MNLFDLALVIPNTLDDEGCQSLIKEFEKKKPCVKYEHSNNAFTDNHNISSGKIISIKPSSNNFELVKNKYRYVIDSYISYLESKNSFYTIKLRKLLAFAHDFRMIKYENNLGIHPHIDWCNFTHASITLNLSDDHEGGEFIFFGGRTKIKLKKGEALIFPADCFWVHEVTPVTKGARYCINSFIRSVPNDYCDKILQELSQTSNSNIHSGIKL